MKKKIYISLRSYATGIFPPKLIKSWLSLKLGNTFDSLSKVILNYTKIKSSIGIWNRQTYFSMLEEI